MKTDLRVRLTVVPAVLALAFLLVSLPASAQRPRLVVDQQQPCIDASSNTLAIGGSSEQMLAQTFTVGLGGRLSEVRFPIGCTGGSLLIEIQGVTPGGEPDGITLSRRRFRADSLPAIVPATFVRLRLRRPLRVVVGDRLAIVLSNETGTCGVASSPEGDLYTRGRGFFDARPNPPGWVPFTPSSPEDDMPFQTVVKRRFR